MRKVLVFIAVMCLALGMVASAQNSQPEPNSVTASDQVSTRGLVIVDSVTTDVAGFVAIHADENGAPGHVVGIAPIPAGTSESVAVMIDAAMATPTLYAQLHADDSETGIFEFGKVPGADQPISDPESFSIAAIAAFDQQSMNNTVVIASAIIPFDGWMAIHADNGGQPGPVLGSSQVLAGTNAPVSVTISADGLTSVVWTMLHVDDGQSGVYEFDGQSGLDAPLAINGAVAVRPINLTDTPTVLLTDGTPIQTDVIPSVTAAQQELTSADANNAANFVVASAVSPAAGFIDVHADVGHPAVSLGHALVDQGENTDVTIALMPPPEGTMLGITPTVWTMLHLDTDQDGQYRYLQIPGADLPVVYNGAVVTMPTSISGSMVVAPYTPEAASEATAAPAQPTEEATLEVTDEMTPEGTFEVTPEMTDDVEPEPTLEVTEEA